MHAKVFFSKNVCLRMKIDLRLKRKQKNFWVKFSKLLSKKFCSPSKKCQSYNFHIWELSDKHFFQKTKTSGFFLKRRALVDRPAILMCMHFLLVFFHLTPRSMTNVNFSETSSVQISFQNKTYSAKFKDEGKILAQMATAHFLETKL